MSRSEKEVFMPHDVDEPTDESWQSLSMTNERLKQITSVVAVAKEEQCWMPIKDR